MLCNLHCLKARLRLLCNKYQRRSSLNLVSQQPKLCNIFIFGMACRGKPCFVKEQIIDLAMALERDLDNVTKVLNCNVYALYRLP